MKKFSVLLTLLLVMVSSSVFAGSIDYLSNQSAKFLMTFTRNASTDASADIANYNPAGTAFLAEGFYIDVSNQTLFKPYVTKTNVYTTRFAAFGTPSTIPSELEQEVPTNLLPNVYLVYNFGQVGNGRLATYCHVGISAGGGSLGWTDGTHATYATFAGIFDTAVNNGATETFDAGIVQKQRFSASSVYYTAHIGASYALLEDMFSLSLGAKIIKAERSLALEAQGSNYNGATTAVVPGLWVDGEYEFNAKGYTPVIGMDVKPVKELTVAFRYEHETPMQFKYDEKYLYANDLITYTVAKGLLKNAGIVDKYKYHYDLPQIIAFGLEYQVTEDFALMSSANIYRLSKANMGNAYDTSDTAYEDMKPVNEFFRTGYEVSIATTFRVVDFLKLGLGYIYTESGAREKYFNDSRTWLNCAGNPPLDSWTIGTGLTYTVIENMDITLAGSWTHYLPEHYNIVTPDGNAAGQWGSYHKEIYNIGIGAGYKI